MEAMIGAPFIFFGIFLVFWRKILDLFLFIFVAEKVEMNVIDVIMKYEVMFNFNLVSNNDNITPVFYGFDSDKRNLEKFFYVKTLEERTGKFHEIPVPPHVYERVKNEISSTNSAIKFPCRKLAWWHEFFYKN